MKKKTKNLTDVERSGEDLQILQSIATRAHYLAMRMIYEANHRLDVEPGDPKVGGHPAASASMTHLLGALHLKVRRGHDWISNKPHGSPMDHAYHYLLDFFLNDQFEPYALEKKNEAMMGLRKFSRADELVFQSYHSKFDPDNYHYLPSGSVGIPQVSLGYLALAYKMAKDWGFQVPEGVHFWAFMGDSELREGSVFEAVPEFAERQLSNLTWVIDYNRQSLDGHRLVNEKIFLGTDSDRIARTFIANGWRVIELKHGHLRKKFFRDLPGGKSLQDFFDKELSDFELQCLLQVSNMTLLRAGLMEERPHLKPALSALSDEQLRAVIHNLGGHDFVEIINAMEECRNSSDRPSLIIAHTIKGWGLNSAATPGNHNAMIELEEVQELQRKQGISPSVLFEGFAEKSPPGQFLRERHEELLTSVKAHEALRDKNTQHFEKEFERSHLKSAPDLNISTKLMSYPHTQWMLGQLNAKLNRISNTPSNPIEAEKIKKKPLPPEELAWKPIADLLVVMAPDVGTSTNMNPLMNGQIFGVPFAKDFEKTFFVKDPKTPDLLPDESVGKRFLRFEITEANTMCAAGSFGKIRDVLGIPFLPVMTVYDFFIKRAHDQYFYNLYWGSSFILVGTPSGVTLSSEGAQHGWKSDFQIPNQITWEPYYAIELEWIYGETVKKHALKENKEASGALIRCVTRGADQSFLMKALKSQVRFLDNSGAESKFSLTELDLKKWTHGRKNLEDYQIVSKIKEDALAGGYRLLYYERYVGYEPGDNVVEIFSMGAPTTEAIRASQMLLEKGIFANLTVVTSPDLLVGYLGYRSDYEHLRKGLGVSDVLYTEQLGSREKSLLAARRVPIVSVHDGEPGLLDNMGSIVGVKQIALATRKHSKCGRPRDVYKYHGIDEESIVEACMKVLSETAQEITLERL